MKVEWVGRSLIAGPYIALVLNEKQFNKAMKHCQIRKADRGDWINPHANATVHFLENPAKEQCCIVALRSKDGITPEQIAGILVHESVHIWQAFNRRIGENEPSDEFEAYCIQTISQRLVEAYSTMAASRKTTKKKKK